MPVLKKGICSLLTDEVIENLKRNGIRTVYDLVSNDAEKVAQECNIGYKDVISIIHLLQTQFSAPVQNAHDLYNEQLSTLAIFSTGCLRLDDLLDGGIYTGEVAEFVGPPASGKTQLCHSIIATLTLESQNSALYIDTGGAFSAQRICEMLRSRKVSEKNIKEVLHRIYCIGIHDLFELMQYLEEIKCQLNSQEVGLLSNLKLIVLDSVTAVVSPHLGTHLSETQGLLVHLAHLLKNLCCDHALSIVVCNNTVQGEGLTSKPALGQYWQYVPSVTVSLEKSRNSCSSSRQATVTKSCRVHTPASMLFKLTMYGLESERHSDLS